MGGTPEKWKRLDRQTNHGMVWQAVFKPAQKCSFATVTDIETQKNASLLKILKAFLFWLTFLILSDRVK